MLRIMAQLQEGDLVRSRRGSRGGGRASPTSCGSPSGSGRSMPRGRCWPWRPGDWTTPRRSSGRRSRAASAPSRRRRSRSYQLQRYTLCELPGRCSRRSSRRSGSSPPSIRRGRSSAASSPSCAPASGARPRPAAILDELARDDFAALPFEQEWLFAMSLLAEAAALLGDRAAAAPLYRRLAAVRGLQRGRHPGGDARLGVAAPRPARLDPGPRRRRRGALRGRRWR